MYKFNTRSCWGGRLSACSSCEHALMCFLLCWIVSLNTPAAGPTHAADAFEQIEPSKVNHTACMLWVKGFSAFQQLTMLQMIICLHKCMCGFKPLVLASSSCAMLQQLIIAH